MSNVDKLSSKIQNYQYMPGISSYGVDGKTGETGKSGNCVFYSNIIFDSINSTAAFETIINKLSNQEVLLKNNSTKISRPYQDGDYIILSNGNIYELNNTSELNFDNKSYKDFFILRGKYFNDADDSSVSFDENNNYVFENGITIGIDPSKDASSSEQSTSAEETSTPINDRYMCKIFSETDENGIDKFVKLTSKYNIENDAKLLMYYDTNKNAFFIDSNYPILLNSSALTVKYSDNSRIYDNYSQVVTYDLQQESLTKKYIEAKKLSYRITSTVNDIEITPFNIIDEYFGRPDVFFCVQGVDASNNMKRYIFSYNEIKASQGKISFKMGEGGNTLIKSKIIVSIIDSVEFIIPMAKK